MFEKEIKKIFKNMKISELGRLNQCLESHPKRFALEFKNYVAKEAVLQKTCPYCNRILMHEQMNLETFGELSCKNCDMTFEFFCTNNIEEELSKQSEENIGTLISQFYEFLLIDRDSHAVNKDEVQLLNELKQFIEKRI